MKFYRAYVSLWFIGLLSLTCGGCQTSRPDAFPLVPTGVTTVDDLSTAERIRLTGEQQRVHGLQELERISRASSRRYRHRSNNH